ncbi:MAG: YraN family protein [Candidatus Eisenbacteria bacterium]|nr:YraN family protein [Candidatus Eisenbacteria bacterium]
MNGRRRMGARGEEIAARHLEGRGFRIRARNYQTRRGEIDLVAERGRWIVFVEVRLRRSEAFGSPAETVGPRKRRRLASAAAAFLVEHGLAERPCRFDIIALSDPAGGPEEILHIENAFDRDGRPTGCWSGD